MHPALGNYVALKGIFIYFSDTELREDLRLVCRQWNFNAVSELVSRRYDSPTVKLCLCASGFCRFQFERYLHPENGRRQMWTELYGADCPMIEFPNVECSYPSFKSMRFHKLLQSSCFKSVACLTLSNLYEEHCLELLIRILNACPALKELACYTKFALASSITSGCPNSNIKHRKRNNDVDGGAFLKPDDSEMDQIQKYPNLCTLFVCFDKETNWSFPWVLLVSFPELETFEICFYDAAALIKGTKNLVTEITQREFRNLRISLLHEEKETFLDDQIRNDLRLHTEDFAVANAQLCDHFVAKTSLTLSTLVPATSMFVFLRSLKVNSVAQLNLDCAAPWSDPGFGIENPELFTSHLVPQIHFKFPAVTELKLKFLKYEIPEPLELLRIELGTVEPNEVHYFERLQLSDWPFLDENRDEGPLSREFARYGLEIFQNSGFQRVRQLVLQIGTAVDVFNYVRALERSSTHVTKLVFQGISGNYRISIPGIWLFSDLPDVQPSSPPYKGLGGTQVEEVHFENLAAWYLGIAERKNIAQNAASLKSIYLDSNFNKLEHGKSPQTLHVLNSEYIWPSSIGHVAVHLFEAIRKTSNMSKNSIWR